MFFLDFSELIHPEDLQLYFNKFEILKHEKKSINFECRFLCSNGDYRILSWYFTPDHDSQIIYGSARDLTDQRQIELEQKKNEHKMIQSSKMATLGEMAGGIAHEINNPLAIISGKTNQIKRMISDDSEKSQIIRTELTKIESTVERIAKIIKGLRAFSRNSENDPMSPIEAHQLLNETLTLCQEKFKNHSIEIKLSGDLNLKFDCRSSQISQVLLNLLNNSHDAIMNLENKWIEINISEHQDLIRISVKDSGLGVPQNILNKIMQPFFTTKEVGKGTGLGLSISKGICEDHHGRLFYDESSKNTCFVIEIPKKQFDNKKQKVA